jgi:hypothetical protein
VELVFVQPTAVHVDADAWGAVAEATLSEAGQPMLSVPVPWHTANAVQLALRFAQGGELTLQAQGLHVQLSSDSRCVEHLSC